MSNNSYMNRFKKWINQIRQIHESTPCLICSASQEQFFKEVCRKENINVRIVPMLLIDENNAYIIPSLQQKDILEKEKCCIEQIQKELYEKERKEE